MSIEGGPRGESSYYRPRDVESRIEGKTQSRFVEVDYDRATHVPLPAHIVWPTARLSFQEVGRYVMHERFGGRSNAHLYTGHLEYSDKNGEARKSPLSLMTSSDKPVLFTGTTNGFYAHDPLAAGREDQFYVVGLQVDELIENMARISAMWHELGHVSLYHTDADTKLLAAAISMREADLPHVALAKRYGSELAHALPYGIREGQPAPHVTRSDLTDVRIRSQAVDTLIRIFHERNAWAAGMRLVRKNDYPTGFDDAASYFKYARYCLATYDRAHNERRFAKGWR